MQTGRGVFLIGGQLQDILFFLEEILCHEKVRNKVWSLRPLQSQSTWR